MRNPRPFTPAALIAVLLALPASGAALDAYRESVFDGAWVGSATLGDETVPLALVVNVGGSGGVASVLSLEGDEGFVAFAGDITGVSAILDIDIVAPAGGAVLGSLSLQYRTLSDRLTGAITSGGATGEVELARMGSGASVQRLWSGTVKLDGQTQDLVLQLQEEAAARGAVVPVSGSFWVGGERGEVVGTRDGSDLDLLLDAAGTPYALSGRIVKGLQIKGKIVADGKAANVKLRAAPGNGKPAKLSPPSPAELDAGATHLVQVRGKNLAPGTLVELDTTSAIVTEVAYRSGKLLEVTLQVGDAFADGDVLALRAIGSDGQLPELRTAFTVRVAPVGVSFAASVQPIFTASCALSGCHAGSGQAGLVLSQGVALQNIVGVPSSEQPSQQRVQAGNAEASYLVRKIRGDSGISGGRMPLNRTPLSADAIALIVDWINQGAANNRPAR